MALKKGNMACVKNTSNPISNYLKFSNVSSCGKVFLTTLIHEIFPKNRDEALKYSQWKKQMAEE